MIRYLLLILFINKIFIYGAHIPQNFYSKAGISYSVSSIEIRPEADGNVNFILETNLKRCEEAIPLESLTDAHVLVYPEYSITSYRVATDRDLARDVAQVIPLPNDNVNPCLSYGNATWEKTVSKMSCLAVQFNVYIVTHFIERVICEGCEDNLKLYSTAVVFDRTGVVVARYRKSHMYDETALDAADSAQISTFTSDFGVTFGLVMSFDLMFESPAMELTSNVTEILVPFSWSGIMPFLTPLQILDGWFFVNKVNLIPGCYMKPSEGYSGCGIFFYDMGHFGVITLSDTFSYRAATANVTSVTQIHEKNTNINKELNHGDLLFKKDDLSEHTAVKLKITTKFTEIELCHNSLCCQLSYQISQLPVNTDHFHYHFLVFDGVKKHPNGKTGWKTQVCGLVACSGDDIESCGDMPQENNVYFSNLTISGNFNSSLVLPLTMYESLLTVSAIDLSIKEINNKFNVTLSLLQIEGAIIQIHSAALYSHDWKTVYLNV